MNDADQTMKTVNLIGVLNLKIPAKSEGGMETYEDTWCSNRFESGCKNRVYCKMEDGNCPIYNNA